MTPLVKKMVRFVSEANLDPTQMQWFDMTGAVEQYRVDGPRAHAVGRAPYKNVMLVGTKQQSDYMLSVLSEEESCVVTGWVINPTGFISLGSFLLSEHNGELKTGEIDKPLDPKEQAFMVALMMVFYAALDTKVDSYVPTPHKANTSRAKRGLKPLYDWHTVVVEPSKPQADYQGGTHASPRRHQARGYWRTYKSGKRGWVKDCWRGDASKGTVFKDYKFEERQHG